MKSQLTRTQMMYKNINHPNFLMWGFLNGKKTELLFRDNGYLGRLSGQRLYRLAKAIVRHWEGDK